MIADEIASMLSEKQTAKIAAPISGDKLYQERARAAFPLLVRQATVERRIYYSDLAEELKMPNPRNLNYVLGSIGNTLENLAKTWKEAIPPIQCLVVNKHDDLPGDGIGWFLIKPKDFKSLTRVEKRKIVDANQARIYSFPRWNEILQEFGLPASKTDYNAAIDAASKLNHSGGESPEHKRLKLYVKNNPSIVGLKNCQGKDEFKLPSGDRLDVSFKGAGEWVAAEVKAARSTNDDVTRGLFQCVKYQAVMSAVNSARDIQEVVRAVLVLESSLPPSLVSLRNILGIKVIEGVVPQ